MTIYGIFYSHEYTDPIVIGVVVLLNAIMGFIQEQKAEVTLEGLKKYTNSTCKVKRNGEIIVGNEACYTVVSINKQIKNKEYTADVLANILEVDKESGRIGLALKDINNDPWELIAKEVKVDDIITGKVVRIIDRGAFVEIKEGVEAFLPISHLKEERVANVSSVVNPGDEVTVRVLTLDPSHKRMSVSIKDVNKEPEEDYSEFLNTEEELGSTIGDLLKGKLNNLK